MASDVAANMRKTTEAFLADFDDTWLPDATLSYRAPECRHTMLPSTFHSTTRSNEEFGDRMKLIGHLFTEAKMMIRDYMAAPEERRAVAYSTMSATTPVGPFKNEYVWFFTFNKMGDKVVKIDEFIDSAASNELVRKLKEAGHWPQQTN